MWWVSIVTVQSVQRIWTSVAAHRHTKPQVHGNGSEYKCSCQKLMAAEVQCALLLFVEQNLKPPVPNKLSTAYHNKVSTILSTYRVVGVERVGNSIYIGCVKFLEGLHK